MEAVRLRVNITAPRIGLNVERVFKSGEEVEYQLWSRNEREIELNLYKIDLIANLLEVKELHRMVNSFKPGNLNAVATWKHSFASKEGEDHKHQNTSLILPVKTSGAYIIMAKGAKVANRTLILISDLANAMKKSGTDVSMFAANAITGEPAGDAEVLLASVKLDDTRKRNHNLPFDVFVQGKTDKNGFGKAK